jgi:hypothetical protein
MNGETYSGVVLAQHTAQTFARLAESAREQAGPRWARMAVWAQEQSCAWYELARTAYAETFYR